MKLWQAVQLADAKDTSHDLFVTYPKWVRNGGPIRRIPAGEYGWWLTRTETEYCDLTRCPCECGSILLSGGGCAYAAGIWVWNPLDQPADEFGVPPAGPDFHLNCRYLYLSESDAQARVCAYLDGRRRWLKGQITRMGQEAFVGRAMRVAEWEEATA